MSCKWRQRFFAATIPCVKRWLPIESGIRIPIQPLVVLILRLRRSAGLVVGCKSFPCSRLWNCKWFRQLVFAGRDAVFGKESAAPVFRYATLCVAGAMKQLLILVNA